MSHAATKARETRTEACIFLFVLFRVVVCLSFLGDLNYIDIGNQCRSNLKLKNLIILGMFGNLDIPRKNGIVFYCICLVQSEC